MAETGGENRRVLGRQLFTLALISVVLLGGISLRPVLQPPVDPVEHADGVVVHASSAARLEAALALMEADVAPVLVISSGGWSPGSVFDAGPREPTAWGPTGEEMGKLCSRQQPYEVLCVNPDPVNTNGEARVFGEVAAERGWSSLAVVTSHLHLARAKTAVAQCTDAEVLGVASDAEDSSKPWQGIGEWWRLLATQTFFRAC